MITALVSSIIGLVGGAVPKALDIWGKAQDHKHELEFLKLQSELQLEAAKVAGDARLKEIDANSAAAEAKATRDYLAAVIEAQSKPTGIKWIDGFNAVLRPVCVSLIMIMFMATAAPFVWSILGDPELTGQLKAEVIWASLVGESIQAVLGFLFGYRATAKAAMKV